MQRLRILTWHVHGSSLAALGRLPHELVVPVRPDRPPAYAGVPRDGNHAFGPNVVEVPAGAVRRERVDCVLYQHRDGWERDRFDLLSPRQRRLPAIYLEHDPPRGSPFEEPHPVDDPDTLLVHVTPFNALAWDAGRTPTRVVEHGVDVPEVRASCELERGLVVVNHLARRGRRLGADVFEQARAQVPLDLIGMAAEDLGGLGEVPFRELPAFAGRYRFLFNPIRWTSLGLAVCEAMALGLPVIGLATTEMATAVQNGVSGYVDTRVDRLVERMRELLHDPAEARRLGEGARQAAAERFGMERFVRDWCDVLAEVTASRTPRLRRVEAAA
ncbi:MAG: glycosyltransferase family 4 protein [Thermoleophilia bacterium]